MFWDKKDERKSLPDLPPLKIMQQSGVEIRPIPSEDDEPVEKHNLPSFPDSPMRQGFSQAAIKDAVDAEAEEDSSDQRQFKTVEMEEWSANPPSTFEPKQEAREEREEREEQMEEPEPLPTFQKPTQRNQDVFIKIEKFHSARRSLEDTKEKLKAIDDLLKKIREIKMREEQELAGWEKELLGIKSRVQDVNQNIFEKLE
ncbi:hypothetical protein KW805_02150 [Candidatus Pacearchaeota archaeon]|nr:hypothetical protein [Candidatus Pacearchaeota archaeon]